MSCNINVHYISCTQYFLSTPILTKFVYASHCHGSKLAPPHRQAQEDAWVHCSWMCVREWICRWHINLAQIPKNIVQTCVGYTLTALPLMTTSQSQGMCIGNYLQWARGTSSPLWRIWLWCTCIHGSSLWGSLCHLWCYPHSIMWCTSSSPSVYKRSHSHSLLLMMMMQ